MTSIRGSCGTGTFDDDVAGLVVARLLFLESEEPDRDITVYINSPGGSTTAGMAIYDTMPYIRPVVAAVGIGLAASMGPVLLAAGAPGRRTALANRRIMVHQSWVPNQLGGNATALAIHVKELADQRSQLAALLARHCSRPVPDILAEMEHDRWFGPEEAQAFGLVDHVMRDRSGRRNRRMGHEVLRPTCSSPRRPGTGHASPEGRLTLGIERGTRVWGPPKNRTTAGMLLGGTREEGLGGLRDGGAEGIGAPASLPGWPGRPKQGQPGNAASCGRCGMVGAAARRSRRRCAVAGRIRHKQGGSPVAMEYRRLGASGLKVSVVGLGTNAFGSRAPEDATREVLAEAIEQGITLLDTADVYSGGRSEELIGKILGDRRHQVLLATKGGLPAGPGPNDRGAGRLHLMAQVEQSLSRLKTDYIDLYQVHTFDADTPLEETLRTLDDLVRSGKVRYIGASNYRAWELMKAQGVSERLNLTRLISVQPSYSLADRVPEAELIPACLDQGVGLIAYFPLAGGVLTGKYRVGEEPPPGSRAATTPRFGERLRKDRARMDLAAGVTALAQELSVTPAQLALAWLIHQPVVGSAIAGATRAEQVRDNAAAVSVPWTDEVATRLQELSAPFAVKRFSEARL